MNYNKYTHNKVTMAQYYLKSLQSNEPNKKQLSAKTLSVFLPKDIIDKIGAYQTLSAEDCINETINLIRIFLAEAKY